MEHKSMNILRAYRLIGLSAMIGIALVCIGMFLLIGTYTAELTPFNMVSMRVLAAFQILSGIYVNHLSKRTAKLIEHAQNTDPKVDER